MHIIMMNPDKLIIKHTVEWLICRETYHTPRAVKVHGWTLFEEGEDWCIYSMDNQSIWGFRGTSSTQDIVNDIQLSRNYSSFEKIAPFTTMVRDYMAQTGNAVMLTGHSLGGALAREISRILKIPCVTFNCAAPPSAPVPSGEGVHYHIVFDIISAWQAGAVRIDKNHRPNQSGLIYWARKIPFLGKYAGLLFKSYSLKQMVEAHSLDNFSSHPRGRLVSNDFENKLWIDWFRHLPGKIKIYFLTFTSIRQLPPVY
jgi:hypothetical protein